MHTDTHSDAAPDLETASPNRLRHRVAIILSVLLVILLLTFIPPLINVSRFQRRITRSISASIGRPVHFSRVSLSMFPSPGFTLENFVINEDPAFGYEPILIADEVHATLRLSSLWSLHPEFSRISLTESTSVNLVHLSDGRWNIESLLFHASHVRAAPTGQRFAGPAPRFPYIEATGARVNLKLDHYKTPFSLDQAEFALWEPESNQWRLRLSARPVRTDSSPTETGTFRIEGNLGAPNQTASSPAATAVDLRGDWKDAQLGGLSQFVTSSDAGVRGDISASFTMQGTVEQNTITADISILNARRADFIPPSPLTLQARCQARAGQTFHSFTGIACYWPPPESADQSTLIVSAEIPDVRTPETSSVRVTLPAVPAATFFNWVSVATQHPPIGLAGPGTLSGELIWGMPQQGPGAPSNRAQLNSEGAGALRPLKQPSLVTDALAQGLSSGAGPTPGWSGELEFSGGSIALQGQPQIPLGDVVLQASQPALPPSRPRHGKPAPPAPVLAHDSFDLLPVDLDLGGNDSATLTGHIDDTGYTLNLAGSVVPSRLLAVGKAVPQLGDGLSECLPASAPSPDSDTTGSQSAPPEAPIRIDLTAKRAWGSAQSWCPAQTVASPPATGKPSPTPASN
jgi:AsmA protein